MPTKKHGRKLEPKLKLITAKDVILGALDRKPTRVEMPMWGGIVLMAPMTGEARDRFEADTLTLKERNTQDPNKSLHNFRARLVSLCLVDEAGVLLFTASDVAALGEKSGAALDRLFDCAREINGMTEADVEELSGNSEGAPSA